jgi:hypothetical protein
MLTGQREPRRSVIKGRIGAHAPRVRRMARLARGLDRPVRGLLCV